MQPVLAYLAGLLTLINPCVLPLLPLVGAAAVARSRLAPLAMAAGLAIAFTIAGMGVFWLTRASGLAQSDVSTAAGWVMAGFGVVLLVPGAETGLARLAGATASGSTRLVGAAEGRGLAGEAAAGALLGLAWSPCIGPTLGAAIGYAATGQNLGIAAATMVGFALGAATVVLALSYGGRWLLGRGSLLRRLSPYARPVLGLGMILVGLGVVFHLDRSAEALAVDTLPDWLTGLSVSI